MRERRAMRRTRLLAQVLLATLPLVVIVMAGFPAADIMLAHREIRSQLQARAEALTESLAGQGEFPMLVGNQAELERMARAAVAGEDVLLVVITDAAGKVLAEASRPGVRPGVRDSRLEVTRSVSSKGSAVLEWEPSSRGVSALGTVRVGFSTERQRRILQQILLRSLVMTLSTLALIALVLYLQLRRLLRPLTRLGGFARQVGQGDLTGGAPVERLDEVGDLTVIFNRMVEDLAHSRQELVRLVKEAQEASRLKGEFLANMSHEIRTPMNGVLGMLALAEGTELTPEQSEYVSTPCVWGTLGSTCPSPSRSIR